MPRSGPRPKPAHSRRAVWRDRRLFTSPIDRAVSREIRTSLPLLATNTFDCSGILALIRDDTRCEPEGGQTRYEGLASFRLTVFNPREVERRGCRIGRDLHRTMSNETNHLTDGLNPSVRPASLIIRPPTGWAPLDTQNRFRQTALGMAESSHTIGSTLNREIGRSSHIPPSCTVLLPFQLFERALIDLDTGTLKTHGRGSVL